MKLVSFILLFSVSIYSSYENHNPIVVPQYKITYFHELVHLNDDADLMQMNLDYDKNLIHCLDSFNNTPLHYASYYNCPKAADILLKNNAPIDPVNLLGDTPLMVALISKSKPLIVFLCENHADIYHKNNKGITPLDLADEDMQDMMIIISMLNE